MISALIEMSEEFISLRDASRKLCQTWEQQETSKQADANVCDEITRPMRDRMSVLSHEIAVTSATTPEELAKKALVALDWINADGDLADQLAASLCRDIVVLIRSG